jgi:iron(III) transport system ATP-binding protein
MSKLNLHPLFSKKKEEEPASPEPKEVESPVEKKHSFFQRNRNEALVYYDHKAPKGVTLSHVGKIYEEPKTKRHFYAVKDANIKIQPGEFVTLLGPSGCGKTTILRMIAGFETPDEGDIYLGDTAINALAPNERDSAMVFQSYALFPHYNVYENVAYGLKMRKRVDAEGKYTSLSKDEIKAKVSAMLDLVQLGGMEERMTNQLSGGQQQRVALARALVLNPSVLLFDEPLSNLDAKLRISMRTEIRAIQKRVGITAVYVTHDQSEAMAISDRIIIMNKGVIQQVGTPTEIYYHPVSEFVADFIGEANFLEGVAVGTPSAGKLQVETEHQRYIVDNLGNLKQGDEVKLVLRPESVHLDDGNGIACKVEVSTFMGSYQLYHVRVGENLLKITEYNPRGKKIYAIGDTAHLAFNEIDVHILPKHAPVNNTIYLKK